MCSALGAAYDGNAILKACRNSSLRKGWGTENQPPAVLYKPERRSACRGWGALFSKLRWCRLSGVVSYASVRVSAEAVQLPYLTASLPGIGGVIKQYDEDFGVDEIPLYLASGEGTHTYFVIEKRGFTTLEAVKLIARRLGRNPRDIGYAGLKDAHGVTRQMLSLEHVDPAAIASLDLGRIRVLSVNRHRNKIKLGHLAGNRFVIKIRETVESPVQSAQAILDVLAKRGLPNYFGPQRFGARGDNALIGRAVLLDDFDEAIGLILGRPGPADHGQVLRARELFESGDLQASAEAWGYAFSEQAHICRALLKSSGDTRKAWRAVHHTLRRLYVSAFQSELFNRVLARRIDRIDRLETGDIAWKHRNGACFLVEDAEVEQPRCTAFEISPTGPLFGRRMTEAQGTPGQVEAAILAESGVTQDRLGGRGDAKLDGARRPLRVPLADLALDAGPDAQGRYVRLTFALPPGAYATGVIREVCKSNDR